MADGVDPCRVKQEKQAQLTVKNAFDKFFGAKTDLATSTQDGYQRTCDVYLKDWSRLTGGWLTSEDTQEEVAPKHVPDTVLDTKPKKEEPPKPEADPEPEPQETASEMPKTQITEEGDLIAELAQKVEGLNDASKAASLARETIEQRACSDFEIGGLLCKLKASPEYVKSKAEDFNHYVEEHLGIKYRKAMYFMQIYTSLVEAQVPWSTFQNIGWTKVLALLPLLEVEDLSDWVEKAKVWPTLQLETEVANYLSELAGKKDQPKSNVKTKAFKLHEDQYEVVQEVIKQAKKDVNTEHESVALEAVAQSYLSTGVKVKTVSADVDTAEAFIEVLKAYRTKFESTEVFAVAVVEGLEAVIGDEGEIEATYVPKGQGDPAFNEG
jgi:hypothetical protein